MKDYFAYLPEFLYRALLRAESWVGVAAILVVLFAPFVPSVPPHLVVLGATALAIEVAYAAYHAERAMRAKRETMVRLVARPTRYILEVNVERQLSLDAQVHWEIWADEPVWTDEIALVVSVIETQNRLRLFRRTIVTRLVQIPPDVGVEVSVGSWHREHFKYRHEVTRDAQPLKGSARFCIKDFWTDDGEPAKGLTVIQGQKHRWDSFLWHRRGILDYRFELVLRTGSPRGEYATPVAIDRVRGAALARDVGMGSLRSG